METLSIYQDIIQPNEIVEAIVECNRRLKEDPEDDSALRDFEILTGVLDDMKLHEDWENLPLINENYFTQFTKELGLSECDIPVWIIVNWDKTAEYLMEDDYRSIEIEDQTFYVRA